TGQRGAEAASESEQRRGLVREDGDVVCEWIVARLGADGLVQLAEAEPLEGLRVGPDRFRTDSSAERTGPCEEEIAGEDRDVVAPQRVGAVRPPPGRRGIHHVVVVEA